MNAEKTAKSQLDRFKEAARQLEADDDEAKFNAKLDRLVRKQLTEDSESESLGGSGDES